MPAEVTAFVAVGSNLGDRRAHITLARERLAATVGISGIRQSPLYASEAIGPGEQPDYLNGVFALSTTLSPRQLLAVLQAIEDEAGRVRAERWGARTLDLDLLLHGNERLDDPALTLPHPRLQERNFVVYPLFDLEPGLLLPDGTALVTLRRALAPDGLRPSEPVAEVHAHA